LKEFNLSDIAQDKYLYLTTVGRVTGRCHTVELWFAACERCIYLSHEGLPTDWMKNLCQHEQVEFMVGGKRFTGLARIITDINAFDRGKRALYYKYYGSAQAAIIDDWFSESSVIEISDIQNVDHT
jgi:hypothetical protein